MTTPQPCNPLLRVDMHIRLTAYGFLVTQGKYRTEAVFTARGEVLPREESEK